MASRTRDKARRKREANRRHARRRPPLPHGQRDEASRWKYDGLLLGGLAALMFTVTFCGVVASAGETYRMEREPGQTTAEVVDVQQDGRRRHVTHRFRAPGYAGWYYSTLQFRDGGAADFYERVISTGRVTVCYWTRNPEVNRVVDSALVRTSAMDYLVLATLLALLAGGSWMFFIREMRRVVKRSHPAGLDSQAR